jgi:hypothetical protein
MSLKTAYSRKISSEEAREGYVLVLKNKLNFFPPIGKAFSLKKDDLIRQVNVESYPCACRGAELPHEHYFISWGGLKAGDSVEIRKDPESDLKYHLRVRH